MKVPEGQNYVLVVPQSVEKIIRKYINLLPHNEWSGILFYTVEGDFESSSFRVICKDILLMDIGEGAHTQFNNETLIADYMAEKPELLDCYNGLVHSHHNLGAFFSGEDRGTLHQEGINRNNFVSLVVDTRGTYVAAITRRVEITTTFTPHSEAFYPFFSVRNVPVPIATEAEGVTKKQHVVQWFPMTVEREEVSDYNEYVDRFAALMQPILNKHSSRAVASTPKTETPSYQSFNAITQEYYNSATKGSEDKTGDKPKEIQGTIHFPETPGTPVVLNEDEDDEYTEIKEWEAAAEMKSKLRFDDEAFGEWLVELFAGTPLKMLTGHLMWSSVMGNRMLESWEETFTDVADFEIFMSDWIPQCLDYIKVEDFFHPDDLLAYPDVETFELSDIFFLHILDEFTNKLEFTSYMSAMLEILKSEFGYIL